MTLLARLPSALRRRARAAIGGTYGLDAVERSTVWLVGSPRSGTTWLLGLLSCDPRVVPIDEIGIGSHLGVFMADVLGVPAVETEGARALMVESMKNRPDYFFSDRYAHVWRPELRRLVLTRVRAQIVDADRPTRVQERLAVVKEPNGSQATDMLMGVLGSSRLLALVRDGRDVIDSMSDALRPGAWSATTVGRGMELQDSQRRSFLRLQAHRWVARTQAVLRAYEAHEPGRRLLLRYEDLRSDTHPRLREVSDWISLSIADETLRTWIDRLAFENVPDESRGSGKFHRAATPGLWRTNLSEDEQADAASVMAPTLSALGYAV